MSSSFYENWLARESWTIHEASLLVYGFNPEQWDGVVPHEDIIENRIAIADFGLSNTQAMLQHMRMFLESALGVEGHSTQVESIKVCQWAYVVRHSFWFDSGFLKRLHGRAEEMEAGYDWYDANFGEMAKKDLWHDGEIIDSLSYCPSQLGFWYTDAAEHKRHFSDPFARSFPEGFNTMYPQNAQRSEIMQLLELSTKAKVLNALSWLEVNAETYPYEKFGRRFYVAKEVVEWAKTKRLSLPVRLLNYMGGKTSEQSLEAKPTTSQIHKGLCQAVAKTLWELNPELTIAEIIKHPGILEHAEGKRYKGKNTLRDWVAEVDPRPASMKRGPKKSKYPF